MKRYIKSNQEIDIEQVVKETFGRDEPGTGCTYISKDGTFINIYPKLDVHEDLCEWVEDKLGVELKYRDEEYFIREYGWIRLRSDPQLTIIELPSAVPTTSQWYSLTDWLFFIEDKHPSGVTIYLEVCDKEASTPYEFKKEGFTEDLIKLLKRFYSSGKLYASTKGDNSMKRMIKANDYKFNYSIEAIPECQDDDGNDSCWAIKFQDEEGNNHFVWVSQYDDKEFIVEDADGNNIAKGLVYTTFSGAKRKAIEIAKRQVMSDIFTD